MCMCVDCRALNAVTIKNKCPLPKVDELFDQLYGASYFTNSGYHQVQIFLVDIPKTDFRTRFSHFEFLVMPFGLTNAPCTFMTLMDSVLRPYLGKFVIVFLDGILIYNTTKDNHFKHLKQVFDFLRSHKLYGKQSKCDFLKSEIHYLGHVISAQGVQMDMTKVNSIIHWPHPTNLEEL